ncbi:hypothetical protein RIF29_24651 [Crotalaria pallida]|uniref:Uncharacterized protein n=1 Tax=Crotalaria pallida TaxID=3830 RepID=A0AAN9HYM9_CROPI
MSASDGNKIISISNVDDEDEDEEVDESENDVVSNHRTRTTPFVAAQRQFAKFQSKFRRIRSSKRSLLASSSSSSSSSSLSSQKNAKSTVNDDDDGNRRRRRSGCKFCCLRPQVLESLDGWRILLELENLLNVCKRMSFANKNMDWMFDANGRGDERFRTELLLLLLPSFPACRCAAAFIASWFLLRHHRFLLLASRCSCFLLRLRPRATTKERPRSPSHLKPASFSSHSLELLTLPLRSCWHPIPLRPDRLALEKGDLSTSGYEKSR